MFNGLFHIREPINEPVLGYEPAIDFDEGLRRFVEWFTAERAREGAER